MMHAHHSGRHLHRSRHPLPPKHTHATSAAPCASAPPSPIPGTSTQCTPLTHPAQPHTHSSCSRAMRASASSICLLCCCTCSVSSAVRSCSCTHHMHTQHRWRQRQQRRLQHDVTLSHTWRRHPCSKPARRLLRCAGTAQKISACLAGHPYAQQMPAPAAYVRHRACTAWPVAFYKHNITLMYIVAPAAPAPAARAPAVPGQAGAAAEALQAETVAWPGQR